MLTLSKVPSWLSLIRSSAMFVESRKQCARISTILLWSRFRVSSLNYKMRVWKSKWNVGKGWKRCEIFRHDWLNSDSLFLMGHFTCLPLVILSTKQTLHSNMFTSSPVVHFHVANKSNFVALQAQPSDWRIQIWRNCVQSCPVNTSLNHHILKPIWYIMCSQ